MTKKKENFMDQSEKDFMAGFGVAVSYLVRCWNNTDKAESLIKECGFSKKDFVYCDEFDLEIINKLDI